MAACRRATFAAGERLIRRPQHSAELSVRGRVLDRVTLGGSLIYVGPGTTSTSTSFRLSGWSFRPTPLVDLATEVEVIRAGSGRPGLSGVLRVENLFNEAYDQVVGFAGRRRGVFGGAKFRF